MTRFVFKALLPRRLASTTSLALCSCALLSAVANSQTPAPPPPLEASHQIPPISQLTVAAIAQLRQPGHDQESIARGVSNLARAHLSTGGADYVLLDTSAATEIPRRMTAPAPGGPVAFLVKVALPSGAKSSGSPHGYYVLATASRTRIALWFCYEDMPGDQELLKNMTAVLARLGKPFADFDPAFVASAEDGPANYMLK